MPPPAPATTSPSPLTPTPNPTPPAPSPLLFHLGHPPPSPLPSLPSLLSHTRFLLLCGTAARARALSLHLHPAAAPRNLCLTDRYTLFQPLPTVLVAAHGIGTGSIDVLLHELHVALAAARAPAWRIIRVGSCGGLRVAPGTVVVSGRVVDPAGDSLLRLHVLGKLRAYPAHLDDALGGELFRFGTARFGPRCVRGDTMCAETFHVAQGRVDGAFVEYSPRERRRWLEQVSARGVVNMEMESLALAAFANRVGVPAAVVCAVLVDRMEEETPDEAEEVLKGYQEAAVKMVADFVRESVGGREGRGEEGREKRKEFVSGDA